MSVTVRIPTVLQKMTSNKARVEIEGESIKELIDGLDRDYTGIKGRLCDDSGQVRRFINIFLNDEDIRFLSGIETQVKDGDEVSIVPAVSGGSTTLE